MTCCPYCKSECGYYEKWCQRYDDHFYFNRKHKEAGEFTSCWGGKRKYCSVCLRDITKQVNENKNAMWSRSRGRS